MSSNATSGYGAGRNRIRYERSFVDRPDLAPYEFYEHFIDAQRAIDNANSASEKWELQILHENRVAMSPSLSELPSLADVAGGLAMQPMQGRHQDRINAMANDERLVRPSEGMRANLLAAGIDPDREMVTRSQLQSAVENAYNTGRDELALGLQKLMGESEFASVGVGATSELIMGDQPLSYSPPVRSTDPVDPTGYSQARNARNEDQGLKALEIQKDSGMPLGIMPDGSYDHYAAQQAEAMINNSSNE